MKARKHQNSSMYRKLSAKIIPELVNLYTVPEVNFPSSLFLNLDEINETNRNPVYVKNKIFVAPI